MITEDYCSFELSKLLKKKGFKAELTTFYYSNGMFSHGNTYSFVNNELKINPDIILAPSLALAMKWLREVHKIFIDIDWNPEELNSEPYYFLMTNMEINDYIALKDYPISFSSYEEAVEGAIKYCLENLIK